MEKFNRFDVQIREQSPDSGEVRVVKVHPDATPKISEFRYPDLRRAQAQDYGSVKAKYGPIATTDPDRYALNQRDRRFVLNELVRGPLSVEEEEKRSIEERVQERMKELEAEVRAKAEREGHAEGLERGYQESYQRFAEEGQERLARLDAVMESAEGLKDTIYRENEKFLLESIFRVCRMVLLKELSTDKNYVVRLVHSLVEKSGVREHIRIRINPQDIESMDMIRQDLANSLGALKNITLEPSGEVEGGGCILETDWSMVDASIGAQIENIYNALLGNPFDDAGEREQA